MARPRTVIIDSSVWMEYPRPGRGAACDRLDEPLLHLARDFEHIAGIEPRLRFVRT